MVTACEARQHSCFCAPATRLSGDAPAGACVSRTMNDICQKHLSLCVISGSTRGLRPGCRTTWRCPCRRWGCTGCRRCPTRGCWASSPRWASTPRCVCCTAAPRAAAGWHKAPARPTPCCPAPTQQVAHRNHATAHLDTHASIAAGSSQGGAAAAAQPAGGRVPPAVRRPAAARRGAPGAAAGPHRRHPASR